MNGPAPRTARRVATGIAVIGVLTALAAFQPAAADESATARTMPNLGFVCPAALGDHAFVGILPDGPRQEQCFFEDQDGSSFAVGASWVPEPADPAESPAVCAEAARTSWHEDDSPTRWARFSGSRRANAFIYQNLYWPNDEKLARQKALQGQSQALGDEMLAVAEELAQPCVPATPSAGSSPSGSAGPSDASSPSGSPEPSPTEREPLCRAVEGQLTKDGGDPVEGVVVRLTVAGQEHPIETATDAHGRFRFGEIPDTERAGEPDAARLSVLVRDGGGMWRIHAGEDEATFTTRPFGLAESGGCRHDLTTASLEGYESANPSQPAGWPDLWTLVTQTRRALEYAATELGAGLRDVPVVIYAWCPRSLGQACVPDGFGAFAFDRPATEADLSAGLGGTGRVPYIALAPGFSDQLVEAPEADTVYHELGHILQADLAGGFTPLLVANRTPHAGYANASSNDSWTEGFASWFAISVRQADGRRKAHYEWHNGATKGVEPDIKAWEAGGKDEEWAVAGLLTDLTDGPAAGAGTAPTPQARQVPFSLTGDGWARLIDGTVTGLRPGVDVVVVDLYDAAGKLVGSDEAYVSPDGRFLDVPTVDFARARVSVRSATAPAGERDDDSFTESPATVMRLISDPPDIGTRGGRRDGSTVVFDVAELHSLLRSKLRRPKDVDDLFIAHGFHENLENRNVHVAAAAVGLTTHLPFDPVVDPRYDARILPAQYVEVDTGGMAATVVVFPQHGVPYAAVPDGEGRVPVTIPGALDSRAALVTLADGHAPAVSVIEGRTFWPEAVKHDRPFLVIEPELRRISATSPATTRDGLGWRIGGAVLGLGVVAVLGAAWRRRRRRSTPGSTGLA
jgi:hypothetical protein